MTDFTKIVSDIVTNERIYVKIPIKYQISRAVKLACFDSERIAFGGCYLLKYMNCNLK